jgi:hypothetical protein
MLIMIIWSLFLAQCLSLQIGARGIQVPNLQAANVTAQSSPPIQEFFPLPGGFSEESDVEMSKSPVAEGGKFIKLRQGPFTIAAEEMLEPDKQWIPEPEMPCRDCYVTAIQGSLEYEDGTPADADTGAMLQVRLLGRFR